MNTKNKEIEILIDQKKVKLREGESLVSEARRKGIYIPTLCFYKNMGFCLGTCRVCTIQWKRHHVSACTLKVEKGMDLTVNSPELKELRKSLVELLFVEGNHFCPGCEKSGDCKLQALAYELKIMAPRFHYRFNNRKIDFYSKKIIFEHNRCVLCKRCTHKFKDQKGEPVFAFLGKGAHLEVEMNVERVDALSEKKIEELVSLCPVGALLKKEKGFDRPYGKRKYDQISISELEEETHE